jgi:hypothetical protein
MNKFIAALLLGLTAQTSFAAAQAKGFAIKTQFQYSDAKKKIDTQKTFMLDEKSTTWNTMADPKDGIALLGRLVKSEKDALQFEYIVVDTTRDNSIISTPVMITKPGVEAKISLGSEKEKVTIALKATPTDYTHD